MGSSHVVTALVTAVLVAGGIWVGATVFGEDRPPTAASIVDGEGTEPTGSTSAPPPPVLRAGASDESLARRVLALEGEVRALRAALAQANEASKPLVELYEKFKAAGGVPGLPGDEGLTDFGPGPDVGDVISEPMSGAPLARHLAKKLGLDERRSKALVEEYEKIELALQGLEKEHARVERDGDTTTIKIARYDAEGERVERRWKDWLSSNLTHEEQAAFQQAGGTNQLIGARLGDMDRTVTIKESGGSILVTESGERDGEAQTQNQMQGPALARDLLLEGYVHLLR